MRKFLIPTLMLALLAIGVAGPSSAYLPAIDTVEPHTFHHASNGITTDGTLTDEWDTADHLTIDWKRPAGVDSSEVWVCGDAIVGTYHDCDTSSWPSATCSDCTWSGDAFIGHTSTVVIFTYNEIEGGEIHAKVLPTDTTKPVAKVIRASEDSDYPATTWWIGDTYAVDFDYSDNQTEEHQDYFPLGDMSYDGGATWGHKSRVVFLSPGTRHPVLRIRDESENTSTYALSAVVVHKDTAAPTITVKLPISSKRSSVAAWSKVGGTAGDNAALGRVESGLVQKRGTHWYAYQWGLKRWFRAGTTERSALKSDHYTTSYTGYGHKIKNGAWSMGTIRGLTKGTLVIRYKAADRAYKATHITADRYAVALTKR